MTRISKVFNTEADPPLLVQPDHPLWEKVREALLTVADPEHQVSIYEMGLIRSVTMTDKNNKTDVEIDMILTAANCPVAQDLPVQAKHAILNAAPNFGKVTVQVKFDAPQWSEAHLSTNAIAALDFW